MTELNLLRNLVWPFCITGCLASEGKYGFFRGFICAANTKERDIGTCVEAFEIVEECWRLRKAGSRGCDWAFVMEKQKDVADCCST
jgi:hypothetical protein